MIDREQVTVVTVPSFHFRFGFASFLLQNHGASFLCFSFIYKDVYMLRQNVDNELVGYTALCKAVFVSLHGWSLVTGDRRKLRHEIWYQSKWGTVHLSEGSFV